MSVIRLHSSALCKHTEGFYKLNLWTLTPLLQFCLVYRSNIYRAPPSSRDPPETAASPFANIRGFEMKIMRIPAEARTISLIQRDSCQREKLHPHRLLQIIRPTRTAVRSLWRCSTTLKYTQHCLGGSSSNQHNNNNKQTLYK